MSDNPVDWFEIYVGDMTRARAFYEAVFEQPLTRLEDSTLEMWVFPRQPQGPGSAGALVRFAGMEPGGNSTLVYFGCADCAVQAQRAAAHGGRIFKDKFSIGAHGFIALVYDSEGNMIGLHSKQ